MPISSGLCRSIFLCPLVLSFVTHSVAWVTPCANFEPRVAGHDPRIKTVASFPLKSRTGSCRKSSSMMCANSDLETHDVFQHVADNSADVSSLPMSPHPSFKPEDVVLSLVRGLQFNDMPDEDAGLRRCFYFSNDMCKAAVGGDGEGRAGGVTVENFIKYAKNPTFQSMVGCTGFKRQAINVIAGTETRGALATQVVSIMRDGHEDRNFLWTLQQERRPPMEGCWLVRQCLFMENAYSQTL